MSSSPAHNESTAAPYLSSFIAPTPEITASSCVVPGTSSAIAISVASVNTT